MFGDRAMKHQCLRIGVLTPSVSRKAGGLFNSVRFGFQELQRLGHSVDIFSPEDSYTETDIQEWGSLRPRVFSCVGPPKFGFSPKMKSDFARTDFDLVHQQGLWTFASTFNPRPSLPKVISPRGMLDEWALRNSRLKKNLAMFAFERSNLQGAACIHALNESEANSIAKLDLGVPIATIPNGVHIPQKLPDRCCSYPRCLPESDDRKVLLFLGRIHPKKGLRELIAAWAMMLERSPKVRKNWTLVIAGWDDGGLLPILKHDVKELQLRDSIIFAGSAYGEEKSVLLARADAFVLPSHSEGLPMSILEAWAYGVPTLMTSQCNLPDGFDYGAAFRISTDPTELSRQMEHALCSDHLQSTGKAGRQLVTEQYSWERIAQMQVSLYKWICGEESTPSFVSS